MLHLHKLPFTAVNHFTAFINIDGQTKITLVKPSHNRWGGKKWKGSTSLNPLKVNRRKTSVDFWIIIYYRFMTLVYLLYLLKGVVSLGVFIPLFGGWCWSTLKMCYLWIHVFGTVIISILTLEVKLIRV